MNPTAPTASTYDELPYDSHAYPQAHPSRLAVVATLFGLNPPPVETCRVLELGCAAGGHLVPMAEALPRGEFVGVDLSARQVGEGAALVKQLGLKNVTLRHAGITEVDDSYGKFDYVVAHGVFSWVPDAVRRKILDICSRNLNPNGVAYVSYNTYPGWHMRGMIRDMMRYHAMRFASPQQRTQQARALLDFLAQSVRQEGPYTVLLKTELEKIRHQSDSYLYHDHLEEVNDPVYFHQFVELAHAHGLRYLGEARVTTMVTGNFGPDVEKTLEAIAADQIQREQYMDFVRNRMFRETLLVPAAAKPNWSIDAESIRRLHVASAAKAVGPAEPDVRSEAAVQYRTRTGLSISTTRPLLKAAMRVLAEHSPASVPFDELFRQARELTGGGPDAEDFRGLALALLNSYISSDLFDLYAVPVVAARVPGEKPEVPRTARELAAHGVPVVPTRRHESLRLSDLERRLVPLLDGTRDREALADRLTERAVTGDLTVEKEGKRVTDPAEVKAALASVLPGVLNNLAASALLIG